jgi:hypothetical protein
MNTTVDTLNITAVAQEIRAAASLAAQDYVRAWTESTGGNAYGEPAYCGFAWVTVYPKHKGNTRLGKAERKVLESLGMRKDYTGQAYQLYNPSGWAGQSMDVKERGATAAALVLRKYGFTAYAESRAD